MNKKKKNTERDRDCCMESMACPTLVLVKIFPNVRHNLQKNLENSCTQVDEVTLMRPTISIICGKLWREIRIRSS